MVVAKAGLVGAAAAAGAFSYNRANYMYDESQRFTRFTTSRSYANEQAEQYRGDLRNLAALTVKKNTLWCVTSSLTMALCVALYCAGRLGLHGPSPPAWIMGLWLTNNAAAFSYMALCIFMAMHASFRAQAASTHLLTRKTRVPVPSLKQLDEARKFASEFEQQPWSEIFRVPYLSSSGAPQTDDSVCTAVRDDAGEETPARGGRRRRRAHSAPPDGGRQSSCSAWVQEEFETDRRLSKASSRGLPADAAPEHFQLYAAVQKEFYQHDVYARVCIMLGFVSYVQALCYYGLGHINIELRAFWVAYACVFVIAVLLGLILRFDIVPASGSKKQMLPKCEFFGPLAVLPAAVGMSMDFKVHFDLLSVALCWVLVFVAYAFQLIYSLRLLEIVLPDEHFNGLGERFGAAWLPEGWKTVPSAFYHVLYFVAPPASLQPGQHDLVREVKEGGAGAYEEVCDAGRMDGEPSSGLEPEQLKQALAAMPTFAGNKHVQPWKLVAALTAVLTATWVWLIFGCLIDVALGEQALVTAPHWSRPPMTRLSLEPHELGTPLGFPWPAGARPFLPEQFAWHDEKRHAEETTIGRRRLQAAGEPAGGAPRPDGAGLSAAFEGLLASLAGASDAARAPSTGRSHRITWPRFFEPRVIACGPAPGLGGSRVVALTARGFGAVATVGHGAEVAAEPFRLAGAAHLPPLLAASWGHEDGGGLLLVSRGGDLLACPGPQPAPGSAWPCGAQAGLPTGLPVPPGSRLLAAAVAVLPGAGQRRLHSAFVHEDTPELAALFAHEAGSWLPVGEVRVPGGASAQPSLAFAGEGDLLVTTRAGRALRRRIRDGAVVASAERRWGLAAEDTTWQGACSLPHGEGMEVAHLHLREDAAAQVWRPEVVTEALERSQATILE